MTINTLARYVLRACMVISIVLLVTGIALSVASPQPVVASCTLAGCWASLLRLQSQGLLFAGLAVLALGPLVNVFAMGIGYLARRDRLFAAVSFMLLIFTLAAFFIRR